MKLGNIRPITELKRDAAGLIECVTEERSPIVITQNGRATAVLVDIHSYEADQAAFAMMKLVAQGEADIRAGRVFTLAEAKKRMAGVRARRGK